MKHRFYKSKRGILLFLFGLLSLLILAILFVPYLYSLLFERMDSLKTGTATTVDVRYMSEIAGIETPEDMQRQYEQHPEPYKFALSDDLVVMFAYSDSDIRWIGMVFIHHFPSVSEVVLDYDGNVIFEQIASPEVQGHMDRLLNDDAFVEQLQYQMNEIWALHDPGAEVLSLADSLQTTGHSVEFLGGRPQTLFDATLYLIQINSQDIRVYEFDDEASRRNISENISPDGYEIREQAGESTTIIHLDYLEQPNFWAKGCLLVQYQGTDHATLALLTSKLGMPITPHSVVKGNSSPHVSNWQTYSNPFFKISLEYPANWQYVDGEAHYGEKFAGEDGYFTFTAMGDEGLSLDQAVQAEIRHKLQPYGPDPLVEEFQVQGQEARLILPSVSSIDNLRWQAAVLVLFPQPISIPVGDAEHFYPILAIYADPAHIRDIGASIQFDDSLMTETQTIGVSSENLPCLSTKEIPMKVCWPSNYTVSQIMEPNRRGSFLAYDFHNLGERQIPYLSEIQFFSEESIETFTSNCGGDIPCFFGDYPDLERFAGLKAAIAVQAPYNGYFLKRIGERDFFVKNIPCYGDDCVIREYISFFGEVMTVLWIVMEDATQSDLSDQLFNQVIFIQK